MRLGLGADAVDGFDFSILNGEDRFQIQRRTDETLRASDSSAAMQEFERIHGEEDSCPLVGGFCQCGTLLQTGTRFCCAGCGEDLEAQSHGCGLTIHQCDLFPGASHHAFGLDGRLQRAGKFRGDEYTKD